MDRRFGSDDMAAEHHQNRIDEDREENGWRCEFCGASGMTETECMYHECEDDEEPQDDEPIHEDAAALADREADRWERSLYRD